ncbi:MAG: Crp/Fnr family transcriptional regulator [Comamonadaceae bacterium]|nr:MAG: Crp/Fnr family transcriptional regulator [Comamonadaceae bacterium]
MTVIEHIESRTRLPAASGRQTPLLELLSANEVLAGLPAEILANLAGAATRRSHPDKGPVYYEGDPAQRCFLVAQGAVEVLRYHEDGEEHMLHRFDAGSIAALPAMFMPHGLYPMTARAVGYTVLWRISRVHMRSACETYPALAMRMLQTLSGLLYQRVNEVDWLTSSNAQQRLAAYLVAQSRQQGVQIELPTSQRNLASQLGIRAETLNRMLAEWQTKGWIHGGRRRWQLCDAGSLHKLAAPGERTF